MERANSVGYKGQCRKCLTCGDVKIWDYPNPRKCPTGKNHRWRPIVVDALTKEENDSIDKQIEYDERNVKHRPVVFYSETVQIAKRGENENSKD